MMENYQPNSNRFKEDQKNKEIEKRAEKIVTGKVITKKKSKLSKFAGEIISEDANSVGSYVLGDVLIPAIKKAISDIVTNGIDIILYGETRGNHKRSGADRVSYRNYYDRDSRPSQVNRNSYSTVYSYDDIVLKTRGEAEEVLSRMDEIVEAYQLVRVADLYDLVGITGSPVDNRYGWTNIRNAEVVRVREGYMIKLPRAVPID